MPRGERGGKKEKRSKELVEATLKGEHEPKQEPSSETGLRKVSLISEIVAASVAQSKSAAKPPTKPDLVVEEKESEVPNPESSSSIKSPVAKTPDQALEERFVEAPSLLPQKRLLSEPVGSRPLVPSSSAGHPSEFPVASCSPEAALQEIWVSLDFHGCLDVAFAGDTEHQGIHPTNVAKLTSFVQENLARGVRVGVTSYIGRFGQKSQKRRQDLIDSVKQFNRNIPETKAKIGLKILDHRRKDTFLKSAGAAVHVDDRHDILDNCYSEWIQTVQVTNYPSRSRHTAFRSLSEALDFLQESRLQTALHHQRFETFWEVLTAD